MQNFPQSTYRIQFHAGFTFTDAKAIVPYLAQLGVTHLYASPYLKARAGSTHGYDVIDPCSLNPELGTQADYDALMAALAKHGMSHILDVVPNHVGIATNDNKWWNETLANGPESEYGKFFDIAWDASPRPELHGKVLLPLLGSPYGEVLDKGELKLTHDEGGFWINYHDRRFPINRQTLFLKAGDEPKPVLIKLNGEPANPRSFDALHELLEKQHYRLAYWKNASEEINYRRFFDVNDLAALAMEREDVFEASHALIFRLIEEGKITGLRLDHPDGLYDPATYFKRLQEKYRDITGAKTPLYLLAEKILAVGEPLPKEWAISGTSGYDFLNQVNGLFVDGQNADAFTQIYQNWLGSESTAVEFDELVYKKKKLILTIALASELHMLANRLDRLAQRYRGWRDFTLAILMHALRETIACFDVYRTYIDGPTVSERDQRHVERAIDLAIERNPKVDASVFHFIRDALLQRYPDTFSADDRAAQLAFTGKFQQLTSPTTAKGIEDTSFYIYNRFVSLNEVGGEPTHFGVSVDQLHAYFTERQRDWPYAMSTLSTHDTKRSEDVRARLNVLSELPDDWRDAVHRWRDINARHKTTVDGQLAPDANDEYLIYQTLLGAWPLEPWAAEEYDAFGERVRAYMLKALREAKVHTIWTSPNKPYEEATTHFVTRLLDRTSGGEFLDDFARLRQRVSRLGLVNGLSQSLIKLTAPGMPDTYQGTEMWDFSLVDPDNRRPVDYGIRHERIEQLSRPSELSESLDDGRAKLQIHRVALNARRAHPGLFTVGDYVPQKATGQRADNVFAFLRRHEGRTAIVIVPRLIARIDGQWGDTTISLPTGVNGAWHNAFTEETLTEPTLRVGELFARFPVVCLMSQ